MDKEVVVIHIMEYSAMKRNEITPFAAAWMDLETVILSMSDRETEILYDILYM